MSATIWRSAAGDPRTGRGPRGRVRGAALIAAVLLAAAMPTRAADPPEPATTSTIAARTAATDSQDIEARIRSIFSEIVPLRGVQVRVSAGVVTLSGTVPGPADIERAQGIASRVAGVVTVQNDLTRDLAVATNLTPALGQLGNDVRRLLHAAPLVGIALAMGLVIAGLGYLLASIDRLWRSIMPNPFLAELAATLVRFVAVVLGLIVMLEVLGATALLGGVLGGAGVIGIALGFAVRDTVDNYVSSLMLSLRQPFRANDHVVIEGNEGRVIRLTSRATVLMTLDGNHVRIPNSVVFKSVILNYTRNVQRRFSFDLGVDADDNALDAMKVGLAAISGLNFVLDSPAATAIIRDVGDSNVVLRFFGWLDQRETDFLKGRSLAIQTTKTALEQAGFALPEPIYRLRFDEGAPLPLRNLAAGRRDPPDRGKPHREATEPAMPVATDDTSPDTHIERLVAEERATSGEDDLLDSARPIE